MQFIYSILLFRTSLVEGQEAIKLLKDLKDFKRNF